MRLPGRGQVADVDVNEIPDEYAWMLQGKCRGADTREFFPSNGVGVEAAQRVCKTCDVQEPCLEYALANHIEQGVWGGASERERRRILRGRRRAARGLPMSPEPIEAHAIDSRHAEAQSVS